MAIYIWASLTTKQNLLVTGDIKKELKKNGVTNDHNIVKRAMKLINFKNNRKERKTYNIYTDQR